MTTVEYFDTTMPDRQSNAGRSARIWKTRFVAVAAAAWARYRQWRQIRRAVGELRGLDERMLKDIGLSRSLIHYSARNSRAVRGGSHDVG